MHDALQFIAHDLLNPGTMLGRFCIALLYFGFALVGVHLVRIWSNRLADHPALFVDKTTAKFIGQLLQIVCFLLAATAYAHTIPALYKLGTALLASASVLSIILGIAAQSTLGNMIAGVALLFYRPFAIGDILAISTPNGKETGTVTEFSLGYTKLLTSEGHWIIAPNSIVISSVLVRIK